MMSAFSWSRTGSAAALKRSFRPSVAWRCLHKTSRFYRDKLKVRVVLVEDPSLPGCVRGLYSRTSTIIKTINDVIDGGSHRADVGERIFMVGMCDRR